jgi:exonuclease SbcC
MSKIQTNSMIILDEPTEGFSESQINKMREVFNDIKAEQIIIVSHDQKIEGFVDHILRLKKDANVSNVEPDIISKTTP